MDDTKENKAEDWNKIWTYLYGSMRFTHWIAWWDAILSNPISCTFPRVPYKYLDMSVEKIEEERTVPFWKYGVKSHTKYLISRVIYNFANVQVFRLETTHRSALWMYYPIYVLAVNMDDKNAEMQTTHCLALMYNRLKDVENEALAEANKVEEMFKTLNRE